MQTVSSTFVRWIGHIALLLACFACSATASAQMEPRPLAPQQRDTADADLLRVNTPMLWVGGTLFLGAFIPSLIYAESSAYNSDTALKYPIAGPWLDLAANRCTADPCDARHLNGALLVLDGVSQGLGVATMLAGLFVGPRLLNRWLGPTQVVVSPTRLAPFAYGVGASGRF